MPLRIAHVITGLGAGGAEAMLVKLVERLDHARFSSTVVTLLSGGVNAERLAALGVPVRDLGMARGVADPRALFRLGRVLARDRPHVVQTWMYHADVLGGVAARLGGRFPVVWNVQNSSLPPSPKASTRLAFGLSRRLARVVPRRIVVCSEAGRDWHAARGYPRERFVLIENGIDADRFSPSPEAREEVRRALGVQPSDLLVGLPARFAPEKDHATFLDAIARLAVTHPAVRAVLCGDGATLENPALRRLVEERSLTGRVLALGRRDDMPSLLQALDAACLSSSHVEAFSNALGEAMAAGLPCVATDVGDARRMLGDERLVVPPRRPDALAGGLGRVLAHSAEERARLGLDLRRRVIERFSLARSVARYADLYEEVASETAERASSLSSSHQRPG